MKRLLLSIFFITFWVIQSRGQVPPNDDCANAMVISIPDNGFGFGLIVVDTIHFGNATYETPSGEYSPPGVPAGQSVWYRFSIPTTREVRILLEQDGISLNPNQAGWTLYNTASCFPGLPEQIDPPIFNIEGFTHACLREGDYLLQVGADFGAVGDIILSLDINPSSAVEVDYDFAANPFDFQIVSGYSNITHSYEVGCQSVFNGERICPDSTYTKSTWHTFTTDNLVDYVRFYAREFPFNTSITNTRIFGYQLYEGDISQDSINLALVDSCRTLNQTTGSNYDAVFYPCQLQPNTTYSVQLLFTTDYFGEIQIRMDEYGSQATAGPDPATLPASHQLGILNTIGTYSVTDFFSCNAIMSNYNCGTLIPDTLTVSNNEYDMNWWVTFEITNQQNVNLFTNNYVSQPPPYIRLFSGSVTDSCNLSLVAEGYNSSQLSIPCLDPGVYSVQILGQINAPSWPYYTSNLGQSATFNVQIDQQDFNNYTLSAITEVEEVNNLNALQAGVTYPTTQNFFDCQTTIMPPGDSCNFSGSTNDRAMYRVFYVDQNGYVRLSDGNWSYHRYKLFSGDARNLPVVNGVIQGLQDLTCCQNLYYYSPVKVCVTPGYYTLVTYGDISDVKQSDQPNILFETIPATLFNDPASPEVMDTLSLSNQSITSTPSYFTCEDNPIDILGNTPCYGSTKMVYREFYLEDPASLDFNAQNIYTLWSENNITYRLFSGRISDGSINSLVRDCFSSFDMSSCDFYSPGWYTVVAYASGETFASPAFCGSRGGAIGDATSFNIQFNPPYPPSQFDTYLTTELINGGNPVTWGPRLSQGHTDTIPKNDTTYLLGTEYFDCNDDLPFPNGITSCNPNENRVSYRRFTLTQTAHVHIYNLANFSHRLYEGDISSLPPPYTVNEDCFVGDFWKCLPPGTYTLVTFAGDWAAGYSFTPYLYIDSVGTSKYDHAAHAYNFGNVPLNGTEYLAAPGAPLDALGRPESNDFIFCATGAQSTDPASTCRLGAQTIPYSVSMPNDPRQNLWYTFEVTGPGSVDVTVYPLTPGKISTLPFAIYKAPSTAYPLTDSIIPNLELVTTSYISYYCNHTPTVNIFRDPCAGVTTDRYVVLIDRNARYNSPQYWPNLQVQVGVRFSNIPGTSVLYDHFSQANLLTGNPSTDCNAPYNDTTLISGTFTGCEGNLTCATKDVTDQNTCGDKTIWYKVNVGSSGLMRLNYTRTDNNQTGYHQNDIQLYREIIPGDSTTTGLQRVPLSQVYLNTNPDLPGYNYWGQTCYSEGTYYIMITGCNFPNASVYPRIWLENYPGDFCYDSIGVVIPAPGLYQAVGRVDCWTIGEGPGENLPELGCSGSPIGKRVAGSTLT